MKPEEELMQQRIKKLKFLRDKNINPYNYRFDKKNTALEILEDNKNLKDGEKTNKEVSVAGRIISLRVMGKASFGHIKDFTGDIQFYIKEDEVGKDTYEIFNKLDIGDIIGINGIVFRTQKGEISILVKSLELLTKNLRPLPKEWYGLKDVEARYRQRYVDLIVNTDVKKIFLKRNEIIQAMREFLIKNGFVEVETPILQPIYGGTSARPFESYLNALNMKVYMRISNELYLKRLIVGGYERIFEFSKDFRNEGIDKVHNPEFLQMETMWAYADYKDNMKFCEDMISYIAKKVLGDLKIKVGNNIIDLKTPWKRIRFSDALKQYAKVDINDLTLEKAKKYAKDFKIDISKFENTGEILIAIFETMVQPKLIQPTLVYDYPREAFGLAKVNRKDERFSEAFEPIINGVELGLSYSEENNPERLKEYWREAEKNFKKGDVEAQRLDEDFIRSLEYGMPPTSGFGIGIDRLVMVLTNTDSIRDVILFPFMRPK